MKIGFDVSQTGKFKAGCGYFADSLIRALANIDLQNEYILYSTFGDFFWDPTWEHTTCQIPNPNFTKRVGQKSLEEAQLFWRSIDSRKENHLGDPDIIHSNNFYCPVNLKKSRLVYTLHDLSFYVHPEWTTEINRIGCFEGVFNASIHADFIITVSNFTRQHFLMEFPYFPEDRIQTVHLASRFASNKKATVPKLTVPIKSGEFWLSVGTIEPRKNFIRLVKAYAQLKKESPDTYPLVIAGGSGWLMDDFCKTIETLGIQSDVILTGYIDDESLLWLYQNNFAFVFPSLFEGFGLPVLEALSQSSAVICSNTTSLPEIIGEAGILISPYNEEEISEAMRRVQVGDINRTHLMSLAEKQAKKFSWEASAKKVLSIYDEVTNRPPRNLAPESISIDLGAI